jgi:hypothetical protein
MKKFIYNIFKVAHSNEFSVLLFFVALIFFSWPFIDRYSKYTQQMLYNYFYSLWFVLLVIIILINIAYNFTSIWDKKGKGDNS